MATSSVQNTSGGTTVSFTRTPQAKDDNFTSAQTALTDAVLSSL